MRTELILIRHGETVWNAQERFQGQQDSPLTPRGMAQAAAIAGRLQRCCPAAVYASDLGRTIASAQPLAAAAGLPVLAEPGLRERNLGALEGLTRADTQQTEDLALVFQRYQAREPDYVIPGGESLRQLHRRALDVLEMLALRHAGQRIAVVSHGAFLTIFLRHILGIPLEQRTPFLLRNGSVSWVVHGGAPASWLLLSLGEVAHLDGEC